MLIGKGAYRFSVMRKENRIDSINLLFDSVATQKIQNLPRRLAKEISALIGIIDSRNHLVGSYTSTRSNLEEENLQLLQENTGSNNHKISLINLVKLIKMNESKLYKKGI